MIIMKKTCTNESYSSPKVELLTLACEQAIMTDSFQYGADNEEFEDGGSYTDWISY